MYVHMHTHMCAGTYTRRVAFAIGRDATTEVGRVGRVAMQSAQATTFYDVPRDARDSALYREVRSGELAGFCGTCARKHRKAHAVLVEVTNPRHPWLFFPRILPPSSALMVFLGKLVQRALSEIEN